MFRICHMKQYRFTTAHYPHGCSLNATTHGCAIYHVTGCSVGTLPGSAWLDANPWRLHRTGVQLIVDASCPHSCEGEGVPHHLAVSPLELNLSLLEAACDDVVSTEQYETPTQQQLSILTPPTGFRTEARTDACETQCDEEGDHVELTIPLTTNAANMIGLKKECSVTQPLCHFQVQLNSLRRLHLHPHRLKPLPLGHLCCGVPQLAKPCKVQLSSYKF